LRKTNPTEKTGARDPETQQIDKQHHVSPGLQQAHHKLNRRASGNDGKRKRCDEERRAGKRGMEHGKSNAPNKAISMARPVKSRMA
jgi:hypothetical protein